MKRLALVFILLVCSVAFASTHFVKMCSVTGGSGQRLSTVLTTAGYTGSVAVMDLEICNPSDATNALYIGSVSTVNASTGAKLVQGQCRHFPGSTVMHDFNDTSKIWLFVATTQNAEIWVRSR